MVEILHSSPWAHTKGRQIAKSSTPTHCPLPGDTVVTHPFLCIPHIIGGRVPKVEERKTTVSLASMAERNPTERLLAKSLPDVPRARGGPGNVECSGKLGDANLP